MVNNISIIITAGGSGVRMGSPEPKQFLEIKGRPILLRTVEWFESLSFRPQIYITLPAVWMDRWREICRLYGREDLSCRLVPGGISRFHSVRAALELLPPEGIVAVHDGVRPLLSKDWLESIFAQSARHPAVIPLRPVSASLRYSLGPKTHPVDRNNLFEVQTPQIFDTCLLQKAYRQAYRPEFTDDATVAELAGIPLFFVDGKGSNIKITNPDDLILAEAILELSSSQNPR